MLVSRRSSQDRDRPIRLVDEVYQKAPDGCRGVFQHTLQQRDPASNPTPLLIQALVSGAQGVPIPALTYPASVPIRQ